MAGMSHLSRKESPPRDLVAVEAEEVAVGVGGVPLARRRHETLPLHFE